MNPKNKPSSDNLPEDYPQWRTLFKDRLENAQEVRNKILKEKQYSQEILILADSALRSLANSSDAVLTLMKCITAEPDKIIPWEYVLFEPYYSNRATLNPHLKILQSKIILLREAFIGATLRKDPWEIIRSTCDIQGLRTYSLSGCQNPDMLNQYRFYHDTWQGNVKKLYPLYEDVITGFLLATIASVLGAVIGVEYEKWRRKINIKDYHQDTEKIIVELILESKLRYPLLLDKQVISSDNLIKIYLEDYLPIIEELRESKGMECPSEYESLQDNAKQTASQMIKIIIELDKRKNQNQD